ncbi:MAG: hypothetical protein HGA47_14880, partial [Zoogloea sp.]|nr:hypothetical protein [Zoogloea sp.]
MNIESSKPVPQLPAYAGADGLGRLAYEVVDHLWPWSRRGFQRQKALHAAGLALAALATMAWAMAAAGELAAGAVIA